MTAGTHAPSALGKPPLERWARAAFAFGLVGILLAVWAAPVALALVPALAVAGGLLVALLRREDLGLWALLAGQIALLTHSSGLAVSEVAYGAFFLSYLGLWYARRLATGSPFVRSVDDLLIFLLIAVIPLIWAGVGLLFGAEPGTVGSEVWAFAAGAVYFPVKEACRRDPRAAQRTIAILAGLGLCLALFNVLSLRVLMAAASEAWQVADARFALNEHYLVIGALAPLLYLVVTPLGARWAGLALVFTLVVGVLLLAKSRAYWGALFIAGTLALVAFGPAERRRLVTFGALGVAGVLAAGTLVLGADTLILILDGIVRRALTLQSALSADISLLNRYEETAAAMDAYWESPVIGKGLGFEVTYYNWIVLAEVSRAYIHNGFAWMLLKLGVVGSSVLLLVYLRAAARGWLVYRHSRMSQTARVGALTGGAMLAGMLATTYTSNPFVLADISFLLFCMMGVCNGLHQRERSLAET